MVEDRRSLADRRVRGDRIDRPTVPIVLGTERQERLPESIPVDSVAAHAELPVGLMALFVETGGDHHVSLARHAELPDAWGIEMPSRRILFVGAVNRRHPRPVERVRTGGAGDAAQPTRVTAEVADVLPGPVVPEEDVLGID